MLKLICLTFYYSFARHLPASLSPYSLGARQIRGLLCRFIFKHCGKQVNIERGVYFRFGNKISLGDNSGLGINARIGEADIGNNVIMGPDVVILDRNHNTNDLSIPICRQGYTERKPVKICDDVWIGTRVIILPGRKIGKGAILGAGSVVTKDVAEHSIVGGNPAVVIGSRIQQSDKKSDEK